MAAGLNPKKKRGDSKPSTILVIFLVFFILISIGLGVTAYYGYAGQEKLKADAKTEAGKAKGREELAEMALFIMRDIRFALGHPLDKDEEVEYDRVKQEFFKDDSKWKPESARAKYLELVAEMKKELGYNDAANKYQKTYRDEYKKLAKELGDTKSMLQARIDELKTANDKFATLQTKQEANYKNQLAEIQKGNQTALAAAKARSAEFMIQVKRNEELENLLKEQNDKFEAEKTKLTARIGQLSKEIEKLAAEKADLAGGAPAAKGPLDSPHALLLDISRGKTLWDQPVGKIIRVEPQERQVYINLGSAHGLKPEVTFNVFAAGNGSRADKELKGSIEVVRILDANTSLARITSLYDAEGREILLTDPTKGRAQRESDNALKEGDLLFNMFWGARVAIAGNVHFAGQESNNPAEQMRILASFVQYLERLGMQVDAHIDLTDGKIKGPGISGRTRYVIRGLDPGVLVAKASGNGKKMDKDDENKKDDEKKDEELKKDEAPLEGPDAERLKNYKDSLSLLRTEAIDKGLFIISVDNFLNVVGYRPPRSANLLEYSGFRPTVITAGQGLRNLTIEQPMAPKKDEPKEPEPKEKEKDM